jgi:nucleoside-diphosphate-sugar epimerase
VKVLLTGVDGYIGSVLAPLLMARGHDVLGLDTGYFREGWLYTDRSVAASPRTLHKDVRHVAPADVEGVDCVIHLAELSNDPLGELRPDVTWQINHGGSVHLARTAKAAGVARFVYSSSCSVYGVGRADVCTETSAPNPQTTYARCKVLVETDVAALADDDFAPVFLRNATAFGAAPRMRFDIVLNNLAGLAHTTGRIAMTSDGTPWRPLVHVRDICTAMICAAEAPVEAIRGQTFNVGDNDQNYQVRDIAALVGERFAGCSVQLGQAGGDDRSYRVSFDKIRRGLPGFSCAWDARSGVAELDDLFRRIDCSRERFEFRAFTRLAALSYLLHTGQVNADLFWA